MLDRTSPDYAENLKMCVGITLFDGFLVNTWADLESTTLIAFRENEIMKRVMRGQVFDIGPLTWTGNGYGESESSSWIMEWLNR
ncbi:UDP-glycosyltransferase 72D1-like protein [Drosera capensis]